MTVPLLDRLHRLALVAGLYLMGLGCVDAATNLAEGASYVFSPAALYDLTHDDGDSIQLTNGKLAPDTMWTSRKAVGWLTGADLIEIEIDLGTVKGVGRVCLRSARRTAAGVYFPRRVDVFTSGDRARYAWVSNLMADQEAGEGPYLAKRFCSREFQREARYIRLLVASRGQYFFSDEVEAWPSGAISSQAIRGVLQRSSLALDELRRFALEHEVVSRMVAELSTRRPDRPTRPEFFRRLSEVTKGLGDSSGALGLAQLSELERDMWVAVRENRASFQPGLSVRLADPWRLATPVDAAPMIRTDGDVDLPQGGHGAIALAVEHALEKPLRVRATAELLGINKNKVRLTLYEVAMVTRADGVRQGDALLPIRNENMELASGESRQLWLDIAAPYGVSGRQVVQVRLSAEIGGKSVSNVINIPLHIWAVEQFPLKFSTVVWGYLDSPPIRGLSKVAAVDMLSHGVTTAVLPAADLPWPTQRASVTGYTIGNYLKFDAVMDSLKGHSQYLFFLAFNSDSFNRTFGQKHVFLSDKWKVIFSEWIREWVFRLRESGIGYEEFALYPVDEPHIGDEQNTLIEIGRLIKETDPKIRVYTTLHLPEVLTDPLIEVVDIFQLNGAALTPAVITKLKNKNKQVWAYSTLGGGKAGNPASFYRAQAWEAFSLGLSGFGFWAYADVGRSGTAWNDTDDERPDYSVIYEGNLGILSSKRWEAWREGVQDFTLLTAALANATTSNERTAVRALAERGHRALLEGDPIFLEIRRTLYQSVTSKNK